jgi:hypothetical protein
MKRGMIIAALMAAVLPLRAGQLVTVDASGTIASVNMLPFFPAGSMVNISVTGTVKLDGTGAGVFVTNPDGSLNSTPDPGCDVCWAPGYQYFIPGHAYPTVAGGDGINHFAGGGGNYDLFPDGHSPWALQGPQSTDTALSQAPFTPGVILRFGALAGTFMANPGPTDWFLVGFGGQLTVPAGAPPLKLVVVDAFYPNNSGSYAVAIDSVPEPAAIWLAFSGFVLFGLPRAFRRLSR